MTLRNLDTMDAKDWIILRLMRLVAETPSRLHPDFSKAARWLTDNIDIWASRSVVDALNSTRAREAAQDIFIAQQWVRPTAVDEVVPFEALLISVQQNDQDYTP